VRRPFRRLAGQLTLPCALTATAVAVVMVSAPLPAFIGHVVAPSALVLGLLAAIGGVLFGHRTGRRLDRLSTVAEGWSRGDFSRFVDDGAGDEIGRLSRQVDRMAGQLRDLLLARQELAAHEERNRLARNLHERVKQQVFAISAEVGTARELVEQGERDLARLPLEQAEALVHQARRELVALIRQLHPGAFGDGALGPALEEWVGAWSRESSIAADVTVALGSPLPGDVEDAVLRVAQEALADVARHSGASAVRVRVAEDDDGGVTLEVADDGTAIDDAGGRGVGLDSMRARVESLGGELRISGEPGGGTTVSARCVRLRLAAPA
jgi:NarL family two-component system sensor histidine kinase LiaS